MRTKWVLAFRIRLGSAVGLDRYIARLGWLHVVDPVTRRGRRIRAGVGRIGTRHARWFVRVRDGAHAGSPTMPLSRHVVTGMRSRD